MSFQNVEKFDLHDSVSSVVANKNAPIAEHKTLARPSVILELSVLNTAHSASGNARGSHPCQDRLFSVILDAMTALFKLGSLDKLCLPLLQEFEKLLDEHLATPNTSRLRALVPEIGVFFTRLPFSEAFQIYNNKYNITRRRFIPPTVHEIRHIMNIAQVVAVKSNLRLVSLDGDETLYANGKNFESVEIASLIYTLLQKNISIAIVTAAGYGYQTEKYEERLVGLLNYLRDNKLPSRLITNFFVFGGESNYLFRCGPDYHLHPVPDDEWRPHVSERMRRFFQKSDGLDSEVSRLLTVSTITFEKVIDELSLRALIVKKERAVGLISGGIAEQLKKPIGSGTICLKPEILDEAVLRIRDAVQGLNPPLSLPFCAFNGGSDVWVDVGNKAEGLLVLQSFLNITPQQCVHIGDQFWNYGNDVAARNVSPTLWVYNPLETKAVLRSLVRQMTFCSGSFCETVHVSELESDEDDECL